MYRPCPGGAVAFGSREVQANGRDCPGRKGFSAWNEAGRPIRENSGDYCCRVRIDGRDAGKQNAWMERGSAGYGAGRPCSWAFHRPWSPGLPPMPARPRRPPCRRPGRLPAVEKRAPGLSLDEAIELLLQRSFDLRLKAQDLPKARADVLSAGLRNNPSLFLSADGIPYERDSPDRPGQTSYEITLIQPTDVSGKRRRRIQLAEPPATSSSAVPGRRPARDRPPGSCLPGRSGCPARRAGRRGRPGIAAGNGEDGTHPGRAADSAAACCWSRRRWSRAGERSPCARPRPACCSRAATWPCCWPPRRKRLTACCRVIHSATCRRCRAWMT